MVVSELGTMVALAFAETTACCVTLADALVFVDADAALLCSLDALAAALSNNE